ncbi:MAG: apolipoprotein N-acyltransferase [Desulfobaccales bacterium]
MVSGLLLAAIFLKWDLTFLLPLALVPFFWALRGQSLKHAFWLGMAAGLANYGLLLYWIVYVTNDRERYFNRAYLLSLQAEVLGYYDKAHLVPYGEYVPLGRFFPFIGKMVPMVGDFAEGPVGATVSLPDGAVGPLVCYESIFPYLSRAQVQNGARLLINITNDAWFGKTAAAYQHLSMAVLRAVENRVSLARAANTGFSAFIGPDGRILWRSNLFVEAAHSLGIPWLPGGSFYSRFGDVVAWACVLLSCLGLVLGLTRRSTRALKR